MVIEIRMIKIGRERMAGDIMECIEVSFMEGERLGGEKMERWIMGGVIIEEVRMGGERMGG